MKGKSMRNVSSARWRGVSTIWLVGVVVLSILAGCHADADDPAGQAKELADPVRRENAIANLTRIYSKSLSDAKGNREASKVKAVADVIVGPLVQTYVEHPEDNRNGRLILDLLFEMRDLRSVPALEKALDWRPEVNEEHAIRAARTIYALDIPDSEKGQAHRCDQQKRSCD
ncbi:MAG: hypothetical protein IPJ88_13450 [Myxococcales bacterium]|nr:MAG: hypothetical protein IPJ88_13450 [Myxococcales bacterium]